VEASVVRITVGVLCKIGLKAESILFTHHMSSKFDWWERVIPFYVSIMQRLELYCWKTGDQQAYYLSNLPYSRFMFI
jgi:hypothetical protein